MVAIIQSDKSQKELHAKLGALLDEIRELRAFIKTLFYEHLEACAYGSSSKGIAQFISVGYCTLSLIYPSSRCTHTHHTHWQVVLALMIIARFASGH